jgi:hypothetical protein
MSIGNFNTREALIVLRRESLDAIFEETADIVDESQARLKYTPENNQLRALLIRLNKLTIRFASVLQSAEDLLC